MLLHQILLVHVLIRELRMVPTSKPANDATKHIPIRRIPRMLVRRVRSARKVIPSVPGSVRTAGSIRRAGIAMLMWLVLLLLLLRPTAAAVVVRVLTTAAAVAAAALLLV
jgi:hypothetical protein